MISLRYAEQIPKTDLHGIIQTIPLAHSSLLPITNLIYVVEWIDGCGNKRVDLGWLAEENDGAYVLTSSLLPEVGTARIRALGTMAIDKAQVTSVTEVMVHLPALVNRPVGKGVTR